MILDYLKALQVFDSRSEPTIKVFASSSCNTATAIVPKGASTGEKEAYELVDNEDVFGGLGVKKAINLIENTIYPAIKSISIDSQRDVDNAMLKLDKSKYKTSIGGNTMLGVSLAIAKLSAKEMNVPLYKYIGGINAFIIPMPMFNVLNGGKHAFNGLDIQEIMIVPVSAKSFKEAYENGVKVYQELKKIISKKGYSTSLGDEGGFVVPFKTSVEAFSLLKEATQNAGLLFGKDIYISLDVAANSFYNEKKQVYQFEEKALNAEDMIKYYEEIVKKYPILSIEDGLAENDKHWHKLYDALKDKILIVGDDLFATNIDLLKDGVKNKLANAMIIKVNQIGTLSETLDTVHYAVKNKVYTIVSHRSGDSEDDFIADLSVGINSFFIKSGAPARSERTSKYNRLLEIENELKSSSKFAGEFISEFLVRKNKFDK